MYTELFSHPQVEAITSWDFTDECWLNAPAGLLRRDNTEKPSYQALKSLIHGAWETHEQLVTDDEGYVTFTGFKGGYTLSANGLTATLDLTEETYATVTLSAQ